MTHQEAKDLAFEKTIEYVKTIKSNVTQTELSFIARVIGNYETHLAKLQEEVKNG